MPDKQETTLTVMVSKKQWDEVLGGWHCPALKIPGAKVKDVFVGGRRAESNCYEVNEGACIVHWLGSERPEEAGVLIKLTEELSTKDLTLRWKKLAIVVPVITALIALAAPYIGSALRPPAESSNAPAPSPPPSLNCEKSVRITVPVDTQTVPIKEEVRGTLQDPPKGHRVWTLVYPTSIGRYYPQHEARVTGNTWSSDALIGLKHDAGRQFLIYAVLADERAHNHLSIYAERAIRTNDSPGLIDLPAGTRVCHMITVTRR